MPRLRLERSKSLSGNGARLPTRASVSYLREHIRSKAGGYTTLLKFLVVGAIGFFVNQFFLFLLYDTPVLWFLPKAETQADVLFVTVGDVRLLIASIVAVEISIVSNFFFHDRWTFRDRQKKPLPIRFAQFNLTSFGSPVISVATINVLTPNFGIHYFISNSIGIALGMSWNWLWNTRLVWRSRDQPV
jgi:putative flippase GtrA